MPTNYAAISFIVLANFALVTGPALAQPGPDSDPGWTVLAGDRNSSGSAPGRFAGVTGVAVDGQGNVYATDEGNHRVQKLSPEGKPLGQLSMAADQPAFSPTGVTVDGQGNLYVVETSGDRIQKLSPEGKLLAKWGTRPPRPVSAGAGYQFPRVGVAVDSQGNIYLPDWENNQILKFSPEGKSLAHWSPQGSQAGQYGSLFGVAVDSGGNVYAANTLGDGVQKLSPDGTLITQWDLRGTDGQSSGVLLGLAVDAQGNLYGIAGDVQEFSPQGQRLARWALPEGDQHGQYPSVLTGVAVDAQGNIYVADQFGNRVLKLAASAAQQVAAPLEATTGPPAVPSVSPAPITADDANIATCQALNDPDGSTVFHFTCDDGSGYAFDFSARTVSMFDPANASSDITRGPWPLTGTQYATVWDWVDPNQGRACEFGAGNHLSTVTCKSGTPSAEVFDAARQSAGGNAFK